MERFLRLSRGADSRNSRSYLGAAPAGDRAGDVEPEALGAESLCPSEWLGQNLLTRSRKLILAFAECLHRSGASIGVRVPRDTSRSRRPYARDDFAGASRNAQAPRSDEYWAAAQRVIYLRRFFDAIQSAADKAAAIQVAGIPAEAYTPCSSTAAVGLGKPPLMHAVANRLRSVIPRSRLAYVPSEDSWAYMGKSLAAQHINDSTAYRIPGLSDD